MCNQLITAALLLALLVVPPAYAGQPCDDVEKAVRTCIAPENVGDIQPAHLVCLRSMLARVESEMNKAYQWRLKITGASFRRDLVSVQKLWSQSTEANCKFFGNNTESAARYECLIGAMIERKRTLEAPD
jgi:uncharacterized protein YecT (DUF1311 family)